MGVDLGTATGRAQLSPEPRGAKVTSNAIAAFRSASVAEQDVFVGDISPHVLAR